MCGFWYDQVFAFVFGAGVAWWFWAAVGLAGAIAVFVLLPALVPERLRAFLAAAVLCVGAVVSAGSWGIERGVSTNEAKWQRELTEERGRLKLGFQFELSKETARANKAAADTGRLRKELTDMEAEADAAQDAEPATVGGTMLLSNVCPPAVDRSAVERVHRWTPARSRPRPEGK